MAPLYLLIEFYPEVLSFLKHKGLYSYQSNIWIFELLKAIKKPLKIIYYVLTLFPGIIAIHIYESNTQGKPSPSFGRAWKFAYDHLGRYFYANLQAFLWILLGFFMLILPGIRRWLSSSLVFIIAVLEEKEESKLTVIGRSQQLLKGHEKKAGYMWLYLLLTFLLYFLSLLLFTHLLGLDMSSRGYDLLLEQTSLLTGTLIVVWLPLYHRLKELSDTPP